MSTTTESDVNEQAAHDWREAGEAWGHSAADWACLYEHYALDVMIAIFQRVGVGDRFGERVRLLDMACGSGLAIRHATAMGATTAGIDAAESLVAIATDRNPDADLRLGSMFELPWDDESFEAVISINGIWGGCEAALAEAFRGKMVVAHLDLHSNMDLLLAMRGGQKLCMDLIDCPETIDRAMAGCFDAITTAPPNMARTTMILRP